MSNITGIIKSIRDIMRKDTGVDGDAQRISQMVWMIFMKIFADKEEEWSITIDDYESPLPKYLKWQSWAADDEGDTGDKLMDFINTSLFPTLKELDPSLGPQAVIIRSVFEDTYNYMKNGTLFRQVINEINKIDFNDQKERHLFNDLYETILKELQSAGSSGEYYTPRGVTQFMVDIIDPKKGESILDPACGTGGFLINSIKHIRENAKNYQPAQIQEQIRGIEKKPLPHLLCTTNLMINGFDVPAVKRGNYLSKPYSDWGAKDKVDVILTNPPFGGVEEDGTETNFPQKFRTKETADLFLALIIRLLKDGGRAAVVLPDGTLFGEGVKTRLKEELLARCNLHTIVRLPNGVFNPYTSIKTNVLFFEKGTPTKEIWYYEHPYPKGYKSYNKSKPITVKEFDLEKKWWNKREETYLSDPWRKQAWKVSIEEIKNRNYNLDIKNPYEEVDHLESPDVILGKLEATEKKINSIQEEIIAVLNKAFS